MGLNWEPVSTDDEDQRLAAARLRCAGVSPPSGLDEASRIELLCDALTSSSLPDHPVVGFIGYSENSAERILRAVGRQLSAHGRRVVVADVGGMRHLVRSDVERFDPSTLPILPDGYAQFPPGCPLSTLEPSKSSVPVASDPRIWSVELLRGTFEFVLLHGEPIRVNPNPALLSAVADGVVLVIEAGRSRRSQIERATAALESVNAKVLGCVLSGRRYPVPGWVFHAIRP